MENNIKEIIKHENDVEEYLEQVSAKQFIQDVKDMLKEHTDKEIIKTVIKDLEEYL